MKEKTEKIVSNIARERSKGAELIEEYESICK